MAEHLSHCSYGGRRPAFRLIGIDGSRFLGCGLGMAIVIGFTQRGRRLSPHGAGRLATRLLAPLQCRGMCQGQKRIGWADCQLVPML